MDDLTAVARLLDQLLWTTPHRRGGNAQRERVHYGPLDVEDLGRVYEALLELEPGITTEPMCRLRRQKLEVVVPLEQGERYRPHGEPDASASGSGSDGDDSDDDDETDVSGTGSGSRSKKTKVEWVEQIPPDRFYLRVGLGRKSSGSYYTPHSFVRFLVQETLGPQVDERCPQADPQPLEILKLKVLDPAMGSGHFLVEACRFLGDKLYEACRLCDEKALAAERRAEKGKKSERDDALAEAQQWRNRIIDLPDPDDELLKYLPSRSPEGEETGVSQSRAVALCRRLVAVHCLYGVDKNPLAVELAKLALWLESHAEGMPLTFLDHRLVVGDSLTGPFWEKLVFRPGKPDEPIAGLYHQGLNLKFAAALGEAIRYVRRLDAGVGITLAEITEKERTKAELDRALLPFRVAAAAWSGGVMLGPDHCDDVAYGELLTTIAETGDLPERIDSDVLRGMIARGLGVDDVPEDRPKLYELIQSGACDPALPYDLTFPEVFYPTGAPHGRKGFHAVVGNPPWEQIDVAEEEYWSRFDLEVLTVSDKHSRKPLIDAIADAQPSTIEGWNALMEGFEAQYRVFHSHFNWQSVQIDGRATTGRPDLYRVFCERGYQLTHRQGFIGWVLPSAFHANEGATGVRQLYLDRMSLCCCYSFENRRKLFEIHRSFKFATVVAQSGRPTSQFECAFYLHDDEWLFGDRTNRPQLQYSKAFVERTGGPYRTFAECRTQDEAQFLFAAYSPDTTSLGDFGDSEALSFSFGVELHRNREFANPLSDNPFADDVTIESKPEMESAVYVIEGKCFGHFSDRGEYPLRFSAPYSTVLAKDKWNPAVVFFRLGFRKVAASTNERTLIGTMIRPGFISNESVYIETTPHERKTWLALYLQSVASSHFVDWQVRQRTGANVNAFIFRATRVCRPGKSARMLAHNALRLTCNHAGYAALWREQLGEAWREAGKAPFTWPVLAGDDERWGVRAAIDAVVADAYGLSRDQYAHVLSTFSHASYKPAPALCLARFDELQQIGLEAFTRNHDPYWDIPLNENLPEPVIELPVPDDTKKKEQQKLV